MSELPINPSITNFREWYENLPANRQSTYRYRIMEECDIKYSTFYYYLDHEPPKLVKEKIAIISGYNILQLWPKIRKKKNK